MRTGGLIPDGGELHALVQPLGPLLAVGLPLAGDTGMDQITFNRSLKAGLLSPGYSFIAIQYLQRAQ